jgi:putative transcriptional regulator
MRMNEKALRARDSKRDIGAELLQAVRDVKAGRGKTYVVPLAALARQEARMSQAKFADLLGVSARTLQQWEQGRRQPTGAARVLIEVARHHPGIVRAAAESAAATLAKEPTRRYVVRKKRAAVQGKHEAAA